MQPPRASLLINYRVLPFMSPRSCFGSIMIIILSMFSASGFVEQLSSLSGNRYSNTRLLSRLNGRGQRPAALPGAHRGLLRPRPGAAPHGHLPQETQCKAQFHRARWPQWRAGETDEGARLQPRYHGNSRATGSGAPARRATGDAGRMRALPASLLPPSPPPAVSAGTRGRLQRAHAHSGFGGRLWTAHACCAPLSRTCAAAGRAGNGGGWGRGAEWEPEAEAPRASKPLFPSDRRIVLCFPLPACTASFRGAQPQPH